MMWEKGAGRRKRERERERERESERLGSLERTRDILREDWERGVARLGVCDRPSGPEETPILLSRDQIAARQFLSLNGRTITLSAGVIWKEEQTPSLVGKRQFGRHFRRQFRRG